MTEHFEIRVLPTAILEELRKCRMAQGVLNFKVDGVVMSNDDNKTLFLYQKLPILTKYGYPHAKTYGWVPGPKNLGVTVRGAPGHILTKIEPRTYYKFVEAENGWTE